MRRRSIATAFGIMILASVPFLSEPYVMVARVIAGTVLAMAAIIQLLANLPVRFWVSLLRLGVLGLSGLLLRLCAQAIVGTQLPSGFHVLALGVIGCFVLAAGPMVSILFRRGLYMTVLLLGWAELIWAYANDSHASLPNFFIPASGLVIMTAAYRRWSKTGKSYVVDAFEKRKRESQEFLARFDTPAPVLRSVREEWERHRLASALLAMSGRVLTSREGYEKLLQTCRSYPHSALAWQIAYTVTLAKRDFAEAAKVVAEAQAYGYEAVLGERALSVALRGSYDPAWRKVLSKEPSLSSAVGPKDTFDFGVDPAIVWRERDPTFARLYQHLSEGGPLTLPAEMVRG